MKHRHKILLLLLLSFKMNAIDEIDQSIDPLDRKVNYVYFGENEIEVLKKKHIKLVLLITQLKSFTPIFLIGNFLNMKELLFIFSAIQIIIGPNNLNIASVLMNFFLVYYGNSIGQYIFTSYILYIYFFILYKYFTYENIKIHQMEIIGIIFTLAMFANYLFHPQTNVLIPVIFFLYSIFFIPVTLEENNNVIHNKLIENNYYVYTIL